MKHWIRTFGFAVVLLSTSLGAWAQGKAMIDEVKERGVLRAGVKNDAPFMGLITDKGQYQGFEIDLLNDLAKRLGVKVEYTPVKGSNRVQLLQQKRLDLVMATVSHYRDREGVVDFSISYLYTPQTLLVRKGSGIKSIADLAGKRVGVDAAAGALRKIPALQPKAVMQTFQSWPDAFFALQQKNVDAVATDNIVLAGMRAAAPNPTDFELVGKGGVYAGGYLGIIMRENDSKSRDTINFLLQDQFLDGTWHAAFDKWLGKDSPLKLTLDDFDGFRVQVWDK
jgi:polar amino acid transport system substrate-binding protein